MIVIRNRILDRMFEWGKVLGSSFLPGVIFLHRQAPPEIYKHELVHQQQMRRYWVIGFWVLYLYQRVRYGYWNTPLEIEARKAEK